MRRGTCCWPATPSAYDPRPPMRDPRLEQYARTLVDTCIDVQPRWQVLVSAGALARPLVDEVAGLIGARSAYALIRQNLSGSLSWSLAAPEELLNTVPSIDMFAVENADALISIEAPENTRERSALSPERLGLRQSAHRQTIERV